jgi:hypothetical protein
MPSTQYLRPNFQPIYQLFHELRLETPISIAGDVDVELGSLGLGRFLALPVATIPSTIPVPGLGRIAEVCSHLGF